MTSKKREWIRSFAISTSQTPSKAKVVYHVTSIIFPAGFPEASTKLIVKKKYSDFQALHRSMFEIHRGLYLRGKFPPIPKSNKGGIFSKNDETEESIEEKRLKCLELLEFCAELPQLCNSKIFTEFFADVDSPKSDVDAVDGAQTAVRTKSPVFLESTTSIHKLSGEGKILDAVALSTDLVPDPTPSLLPNSDTKKNFQQVESVVQRSSELSLNENSSPDEIPEYLSDAANFISLAMQYECEEKYGESVNCYRNAIGTLLESVQKDSSLKRQASVKRRIAQYISKAETLMKLESSSEDGPKMSSSRIPHLDLFGNIRDLRKFKIESILAEKVLLVSDIESENKVVIKALQKSSLVFKHNKTSMLPVNIPFMVKLLKYFETEEFIYLVLEYIPNGQLLSQVRIYLDNQIKRESQDLVQDIPVNRNAVPNSTSVAQLRRKSSFQEPETMKLRRSLSSAVEMSSGQTRDFMIEQFRSGSLEQDSSSSEDEFDFVHTEENNMFCIGKHGIEKMNSRQSSPHRDVIKNTDSFTEEKKSEDISKPSENLTREQISIRVQCGDSPSKIVHDSEVLLSTLTSELASLKETKTAENLLLEVENIERSIYQHLDSRNLTLTPNISPRPTSRSSISAPSTSSMSSSPPPRYADEVSEDESVSGIDDTILSNFVSQFDHVGSVDVILPMELIRRWTAQLCHVVSCLHARGVVIQDLNPSNILLGSDLKIRLTYQCEWVSVDRPVNWKTVEDLYSAPEVASVEPLTPACDWWSVGAILFQLLTGRRLVDVHPSGLLPHTPLQFPESVRREACERKLESDMRSLVTRLLNPIPLERLGAGSNGSSDVRSHAFFSQVNWSSA